MLHRMQLGDSRYGGHTTEFLRTALQYLQDNGYQFISLKELIKRAVNGETPIKKAVAFTMDDGYLDQAAIALPIFIEYDCPVTVFLITDFIDKKAIPWDSLIKFCFYETKEQLLKFTVNSDKFEYLLTDDKSRFRSFRNYREYCNNLAYDQLDDVVDTLCRAAKINKHHVSHDFCLPMSWSDARRLEDNRIQFGPHTVTHGILSNIPEDKAMVEISESWSRLNKELTNPAKILAYPIGKFTDFLFREVNYLKNSGFTGAVTAEPGYLNQADIRNNEYSRFMIKRFSFPDNLSDLIQYVTGFEYIKDKIRYYRPLFISRRKQYVLDSYVVWIKNLFGFFNKYNNIDWSKVDRLVFICKGNICRSPYAEYKAGQMGLNAISAGIKANGISPADEHAIKQSAYRNVDISQHRSRIPDSLTFLDTDLIVCMEPNHIQQLEDNNLIKSTGCQYTLLGLWSGFRTPLIHDPFGNDEIAFQKCFEKIDNALANISYKLNNPRL